VYRPPTIANCPFVCSKHAHADRQTDGWIQKKANHVIHTRPRAAPRPSRQQPMRCPSCPSTHQRAPHRLTTRVPNTQSHTKTDRDRHTKKLLPRPRVDNMAPHTTPAHAHHSISPSSPSVSQAITAGSRPSCFLIYRPFLLVNLLRAVKMRHSLRSRERRAAATDAQGPCDRTDRDGLRHWARSKWHGEV